MSSPVPDLSATPSPTSNSPQPRLVAFSRSPIEDWEKCPRKRYLGYHWGGRGIERTTLNLDLSIGITTHAILARTLMMVRDLGYNQTEFVNIVSAELEAFERNLRQRGVQLEMSSGYEQDEEGNIQVAAGNLDFIVGLWRCWIASACDMWVSLRLPHLIQEYVIVTVEEEEELLLPGTNLLFLSRLDALLQRRSDGEYFILNFKTVGEANGWWLEQWRHDMQTLSEMLPIEAKLGQRVSGVLIEGIVKGRKSVQYPKDSGQWYNSSPFCWAWKKSAAPPFPPEYAGRYEWNDMTGNHRLGKGWQRTPVFQDPDMGGNRWMLWLLQHDPQLVEQQFVALPPILRQDYEVDQWLRQAKARESAIAYHADLIQLATDDEEARNLLDAHFPMHTGGGNCIRPNQCQFYNICWGPARHDPLNSGYQIRKPNHPKEAEVLGGN